MGASETVRTTFVPTIVNERIPNRGQYTEAGPIKTPSERNLEPPPAPENDNRKPDGPTRSTRNGHSRTVTQHRLSRSALSYEPKTERSVMNRHPPRTGALNRSRFNDFCPNIPSTNSSQGYSPRRIVDSAASVSRRESPTHPAPEHAKSTSSARTNRSRVQCRPDLITGTEPWDRRLQLAVS